MLIKLAKFSGFCFGVQRAMDLAWDSLDKNERLYSLGPLIHNAQAIKKYESRGLKLINHLDEVSDESTVVIRSHGVSFNIYKTAKQRNINLIDTTCPFVKKIQNIVHKFYLLGYSIIIIGDKSHPEVVGINGWCSDSGIIIKELNNLKDLNFINTNYCVVAQTTINVDLFEDIVNELKKRIDNVKIYNTICLSTRERQDSAKQIADEVDCMIVIGGNHSSNTQKLVDICKSKKPTYAIETVQELKTIDLSNVNIMGITAGASTPKWIIDEVIEYLEK